MLTFYILALLAGCIAATPYKPAPDDDIMIGSLRDPPGRRPSKRGPDFPSEKPYAQYEPLDEEYLPPALEKEDSEYKYFPMPRRFSSAKKVKGRGGKPLLDQYEPLFENKTPSRSGKSRYPEFAPDLGYESEPNQADTGSGHLPDDIYENPPKEPESNPISSSPTFERLRPPPRPQKMHYKRLFAQDLPSSTSSSRREFYEPEEPTEDNKYDKYEIRDDDKYLREDNKYDRDDGKYEKYDKYDKEDSKYDKYDREDRKYDKYDREDRKFDKYDREDSKFDKYDREDRKFDKYEREDSKFNKFDRTPGAPSRPAARPVTTACNENDEGYESTECDCS